MHLDDGQQVETLIAAIDIYQLFDGLAGLQYTISFIFTPFLPLPQLLFVFLLLSYIEHYALQYAPFAMGSATWLGDMYPIVDGKLNATCTDTIVEDSIDTM